MQATQSQMTVLDFETTGTVRGLAAEPWQLGMIAFRACRPVADATFESLLYVGDRPFSPYAPGRYAALRPELREAPSLTALWPTVQPWFTKRILVAHNVATERNCLANAFPLHPFGPWIDTLTLVRIAYPQLATHKLDQLVEDLKLAERVAMLCPGREAHDALFDAVACAVLLEHLLSLPGWEDATVETLVHAQPHSYHRQRAQKGNAQRNR